MKFPKIVHALQWQAIHLILWVCPFHFQILAEIFGHFIFYFIDIAYFISIIIHLSGS